jgi:arylsulfatase A-like enzyme
MAMSWRKQLTFALLATVAVLGLAVGYRTSHRAEGGPNIVLIVVDALRSDHLGVYGYERDTSPHLDRLAARGVLFRNAYTSATMSKPALSSLLTSTHPSAHNALDEWVVLSDRALTLAEVLRDSGYRTVLFNGGNPYLTPTFNLAQGFDQNRLVSDSGRLLTDEFLRELPKLKSSKFFAYIHYMDVHTPYRKHEYNTLFKQEISPKLGMVWGADGLEVSLDAVSRLGREDPDARESLIALYDGEIRHVDEQVQRVIDALHEHGLVEDTLVIFTADHGEQLWDHGGFGHGDMLFEEGIRVPLMLFGNGLAAADVTSRVRLIDIFPTILESTGDDPGSYPLQGVSLWPAVEDDVADRAVFSMLGSPRNRQWYYTLIDEGTKLHVFVDGEKVTRALYDLERDPHEQLNVAEARPQLVDSLAERLQQYIAVEDALAAEPIEIEGELKDRLKSLGYLQ